MSKPSELNTTGGAVTVSYRSRKVILKSAAADISISSSKPVFDPMQNRSTLHVQTKEATRDPSAPDNDID